MPSPASSLQLPYDSDAMAHAPPCIRSRIYSTLGTLACRLRMLEGSSFVSQTDETEDGFGTKGVVSWSRRLTEDSNIPQREDYASCFRSRPQ